MAIMIHEQTRRYIYIYIDPQNSLFFEDMFMLLIDLPAVESYFSSISSKRVYITHLDH